MEFGGVPPVGGAGGPGGVFGADPSPGFDNAANPVIQDLKNIQNFAQQWKDGTFQKKYAYPAEALVAWEAGMGLAMSALKQDFATLDTYASHNPTSNPQALGEYGQFKVTIETKLLNPKDANGNPMSTLEKIKYYTEGSLNGSIEAITGQGAS